MRDGDCVAFLRWALPRLELRWQGFRRPRRQVCRRIRRRLREIGLPHLRAYRQRLREEPDEWDRLARLCRVTISRFFRDRELFRTLADEVLPSLTTMAGGGGCRDLAAWSAGCGAGEEPYTLAIVCRLAPSLRGVRLRIVGTDVDRRQLERARRGVFPESSLRDVPESWRRRAFAPTAAGDWRLDPAYRRGVELIRQDLRQSAPPGPFDLVLCRNLAFTYFAESLQRRVLQRIRHRLRPGGALVVGGHELLPDSPTAFEPWRRSVWRAIA